MDIQRVVEQISSAGTYYHHHPDIPHLLPMRSLVLPALGWDQNLLESKLKITLPQELVEFWDRTSGAIILEDMTYHQWGLVIWSPDQALVRHWRYSRDMDELMPGELIVGEFLGDLELVVMQCDPDADDFGSIIIALPIDPRTEWPCVGASLGDFLIRFMESNHDKFGQKYWLS